MIAPLAGLAFCLLLLLGAAAAPAIAATRAGTFIVNRAQTFGQLEEQAQRLESNIVSDRIDELLDVSMLDDGPSPVPLELGNEAQPVPFLLRNTGNGSEAFSIAIETSGDGAKFHSLAVDANDDGRFDPAIDTIIGSNDPTPPLEPGATLRLFALVDAVAEGAARLVVHARSVTGIGAPGTLFAGRGDGGGDAVTGVTRGEASIAIDLAIAGSAVSLIKSQQVLAAGGLPVRGATIRYVIEARVSPGVTVNDARLVDPVPAGTTYVPGSLRLDGTTLSDAPDGDAGLLRANSIEVVLGTLAAASVRTIAFDVKIN